jgi:hypothetical protein
MANDKTSEYAISADPTGYEAGMKRVIAASKETQKTIETAFSSVGNMMGKLTGMIGGLTAVLAGGAAFKEVVSASNAWNGEAKKLSVTLGVTTQQASVMMVAMRHLGVDSDLMTTASSKLSKQVITNSDAFAKLGVKVKDTNGQYRPMTEIMANVNDKLKEIKNPIEQNNVGLQVYGKSWAELRGTLKLTSDEIEKARGKAETLGLIVGPEGVAQTKQYKETMNDMKLVMTSLEVQLGATVLPTLVQLGSWFSGVGPTVCGLFRVAMESVSSVVSTCWGTVQKLWSVVSDSFSAIGGLITQVMGTETPSSMEIFTNALKVVEIAFVVFNGVVRAALQMVAFNIQYVVAQAQRMAEVMGRALHGDWDGVKAAWDSGAANIERLQADHVRKMVKIATDGKDEINNILLRGPKQAAPAAPEKPGSTGGPTYDFNSDAGKQSRMAGWEAKLAQDKDGFEKAQVLAGTAQEYGKARERDYWKNLLQTAKLSLDERNQVQSKYLGLEKDIRQAAFDSQIAGEKSALEEYRNDHEQRIAIATTIYEQLKARYGADSKEAKGALAEIAKEQRKLAEQTLATNQVVEGAKRAAALAAIDDEQRAAELQLGAREISAAKMLELELGFEGRRYAVKQQALAAELALLEQSPDRNPTAIAQIHAQIEEAQRKHVGTMAQINGQAAAQSQAPWMQMTGQIRSSYEDAFAGMISGANTVQKGLGQAWQATLSAFSAFIAKKVGMWIMGETTQTAATVAGNSARVTSDWWAATQSTMANAWSAIKNIAIKAWEAAAAVYASIAAIPGVGPFLAPGLAVVASGAVLGFAGHIASARGGYDIPAGVNPVTQLHEKEMVLPAAQADVVRNMADNGGTGGGDVHLHVHAVDAHSVKRLFENNGAALVATLRKQGRNFANG